MRAWDELATGWRQAILDVVARAVADGRWPPPWQLARMDRLAQAVVAATQALEALSQQAGVTVTNGAATIVAATAAAEPMVYASQLPAAVAGEAAAQFAGRISPS